ncbi:GNAT family N-acetyltransferase [Stakelama tenebrarum]|uniref:GNAT family N-acetyltransferase n=1 Tax=Stakelama tenebrarum TaxID=2711215 RepID=A0A6G6Y2F4_9SPHN|nr:GNAT family N-acetyltransferase [Sphingosinithalassobacter tenebrarum]QIG78987.1 GNAT family N-acetyltransferase [Sphingosinithalassobacter tenebrarum]
MTRAMPLSEFPKLPPALSLEVVEGLSAAIDTVAERAAPTHRFLRYGWFAAALAAYGGHARTILALRENEPVAALPLIATGPEWLRLASVPGCYWPFRSFPIREDAGAECTELLLDRLGREVNALRIGPVYDGDPGLEMLRAAAAARGWTVIDRTIAQSFLLDMGALRAEGTWPRSSTLRRNRNHEKHLGEMGALDWRFVSGPAWNEAVFDDLAAIEEKSWIAERTDGSDAKFTREGHGAFWRAAAADPVLAQMMAAAVLTIGGEPAAFSLDVNAGDLKYAVANSYDPQFGKHSPGKLLYYRNLVQALDHGIRRVDWGAGDSGYKRVVGAQGGPMIRDWLFVRPGPPGMAAKLARGLWRRSGNDVAD